MCDTAVRIFKRGSKRVSVQAAQRREGRAMTDKRKDAANYETVPSNDIPWSLDPTPYGRLHRVAQCELRLEVLA